MFSALQDTELQSRTLLGLYPFSVAIAGLLTTTFGPVLLFPLSGIMMLIAAIFGWSLRPVREL